jgi:hypothetical protein
MADNTGGNSGRALWQVDRFELIFYNPRNKRWQYFAEDPATREDRDQNSDRSRESLHRREIRDLLRTVRNTFRFFLQESSLFTLCELRDADLTGEIKVEPPPASLVAGDRWLSYLRYLRKTAEDEGVSSHHFSTLESWIANPTETQNFSLSEALTVLSFLPIMEDWDTWGCFIRAQTGRVDPHVEGFPPASAVDWSEPFSIVELQYSEHDAASCGNDCSQKDFLKKHVQIEGLCQDISDPSARVHHVRKADFFDRSYCKLPGDEEKSLYQCYAHLIDPLFAAPSDYAHRRQFVIAYPILSGGRLHFLQVITSADIDLDVSVCSLWIDWAPIHQAFWTTDNRSFLQDELLRISTSAFQNEAYHDLKDSISAKPDGSDLFHCLLQHIYHLLPIVSATFGETVYSYKKPKWQDPSDLLGEGLYVGSEWIRSGLNSEEGEGKTISPNVLAVPIFGALNLNLKRNSNDRQISALTKQHRAIQVVEQQMQYLTNLQNALYDERRRKEKDREMCAMVVYGHIRKMMPETLALIGESAGRLPDRVLRQEVEDPVVYVGEHFIPADYLKADRRRQFGRYLQQAYPNQSRDNILANVKSLSEPSLLLLLSEYFETGLAKLKTHSYADDKLIKCSRDEAMQHCNELYQKASERLTKLQRKIDESQLEATIRPHGSSNPLRTSFDRFHEKLSAGLKKKVSSELSNSRKELEMTQLHLGQDWPVIIQAEDLDKKRLHPRIFGICPCCLLKPFIEKYKEEIGQKPEYRGRGEFTRVIRLHKKARYWSPYHGAQQFPTYLVTHQLFLPYAIENEEEWSEKSELLNCWSRIGEPVGSLYTYSAPSLGEGGIAKLLLTHPIEGRANRELLCVPSVVERFRIVESGAPASYLILEFQHWWMDEAPNHE